LVTHKLYATLILLGSAAYVLLLSLSLATEVSGGLAIAVIFGFRAAAIRWEPAPAPAGCT
jgi:uncharacterized membrane protein YeiH